jgi:hypothetical protein
MTDLSPATISAVDAYLEALTEKDADRRAELVATAWTDDARFVDPLLEATGHDAIAALTDVVVEHYPGHSFRRTSAVDSHHDQLRFTWDLVAPDGGVAATGVDVAQVAADGRLAMISGFFGEPPAIDAAA